MSYESDQIRGSIPFNPVEHERYLIDLLLPRTRTYLAQEALKAVEPDDFCHPMYAEIWRAARAISADGSMITSRGIRTRVLLSLPEGRSGRAGGQAALDHELVRMAQSLPPVEFAAEAMRVVHEQGALRQALEATMRMHQRILECVDPAHALTAITEELDSLGKVATSATKRSLADALPAFEDAMRGGPSAPIVPTPWQEYNDYTGGGLHGGRVLVVGGRPGDGKSNVGLILAAAAAIEGNHALVFSAEMDSHDVIARVVARAANIELGEISSFQLSEYSWRQYQEFKARAADIPLFVDDRAGIGMPYIKTVARQHAQKHDLRVIFVDYLQLLKTENKRISREQQVAEISRELKELARELNVAVIVAAQLNREAVGRSPLPSDLRESGAIEADADQIVLLEHERVDGQATGTVSLHLVKNRQGRTGEIVLRWRGYMADIQ